MRLINADKLAITPIDVTDLPQDRCLRVVLWEDVEKAETVDAIPTKWIKEWIDNYVKYSGYNSYMLSVVEMLDDWREENE